MGTRVSIESSGPVRAAAVAASDEILRVIEATERELSSWRDDSVVSRLNRQPPGQPLRAPSELCTLFVELAAWHDRTSGAFDPAVGALLDAWGIRESGRVPTASGLERARARSGWRHLRVETAPCALTREADVSIDAGAFGKGVALDRVASRLTHLGAWMIDLGGQVMVGPAGARHRAVSVAHPSRRGQAVLDLRLDRGSLAVSGGSERDLEADGRVIGHVLDPRSGRPVSRAYSVAVWHPRALVADVLSTALYVMGVEEGTAWADAHGVAVCYIVPDAVGSAAGGVELLASDAFRSRFLVR